MMPTIKTAEFLIREAGAGFLDLEMPIETEPDLEEVLIWRVYPNRLVFVTFRQHMIRLGKIHAPMSRPFDSDDNVTYVISCLRPIRFTRHQLINVMKTAVEYTNTLGYDPLDVSKFTAIMAALLVLTD